MSLFHFDDRTVPDIRTPLPGPTAQGLLARDAEFVSGSYTRIYPLVVARGSGAVVEDVDGNLFLDFTAGIAVNSTGTATRKSSRPSRTRPTRCCT